jgi:LCP family protein required for cell wall assembly
MKRALAIGGVVFAVAAVLIGIQGWKIVSALVETEQSVVVPLPTREANVPLGGASKSGALAPAITPEHLVTPSATARSASSTSTEQNAQVVVTQAPRASTAEAGISPTKMPNVTVAVTPGHATVTPASAPSPTETAEAQAQAASINDSTPTPSATSKASATVTEPPQMIEEDATGGPDVTATVEQPSSVTPSAVASAASPTVPAGGSTADSSDGPSAFDIVRNVVGAGMDNGDPGTSKVWNGKTSLTILVVGLDRRPDGGDQNADVIMIAQLDLVNKTVRAVSLPRDLLVQIPGIGYDKINSAYNYGIKANPNDSVAGVAMVRDTVEYNFGIPIDEYVLVDFNGFKKVIDATGGIDVNVPYDIVDDEYPTDDYNTESVHFAAGPMHMDGETALKYVRTRHADSDDQRRERQLQVLQALFEQGKSAGSINKIDDMILALGGSAQTSFTLEQQLTLARLALQLDSSEIVLSSLAPPLLQAGYTDSGAWVYTGDMNEIVAFVQNAVYGDGQ